MRRFVHLAALFSLAIAAPPAIGPYATAEQSYKVGTLDRTDASVWLVYPANATAGTKFPLISYLHGLLGGDIDLLGYWEHFAQLASYGFVVAAADSCDVGCTDPSHGAPWTDCAGVPLVNPQGEGWGPYYGEGLKTIDWARNQSADPSSDPIFHSIDWAAGVGLAGHSMGGQAATIGASAACAARWGIKALALHHPYDGQLPSGNAGVNISVPVIGLATSGDSIWPLTEAIMNATTARPAAYRNEIGWSHLEPVLVPPIENPLLATYTAAWFKVVLGNDTGAYRDLIYGAGPDAMCNHAPMQTCYTKQQ